MDRRHILRLVLRVAPCAAILVAAGATASAASGPPGRILPGDLQSYALRSLPSAAGWPSLGADSLPNTVTGADGASLTRPFPPFGRPAQWKELASDLDDAPSDDPTPLVVPGQVSGRGTFFEVTGSGWHDVTLTSTEPIVVSLQSMPGMVHMSMHAEAAATTLTLSGLSPSTGYYLYAGDYHQVTPFVTDSNGAYTWQQEIPSDGAFLWVQPRTSTLFLRNNATGGDCADPIEESALKLSGNGWVDTGHSFPGMTAFSVEVWVNMPEQI